MQAALRLVSLDHLSFIELNPPQLVSLAAAADFSHVGLRLQPAAPPQERQHPMLGDTGMRRDTLARLRDTGVVVWDFGVFRLRQGMDLDALEPVLETAATLGARHAVVSGDERSTLLLSALLHALCERGQRYGLRMHLEPTMWSGIPTLAAALAVLQACGHAAARLMVDLIHADRSGTTLAELAALPPALIDYIQVCDASAARAADVETLIYQARNERAYPGEGGLNLTGMLNSLPPGLPLSLEAPVNSLARRFTLQERALRARQAMDALLVSPPGCQWRKERDSNPRGAVNPHTLSRRAT